MVADGDGLGDGLGLGDTSGLAEGDTVGAVVSAGLGTGKCYFPRRTSSQARRSCNYGGQYDPFDGFFHVVISIIYD